MRPHPACTSSAISRILFSLVNLRSSFINSLVLGITPPSPWMGSIITATVLSVTSFLTDSKSFNSAFGKPATCGANIVSHPGFPEALIVANVRPWKLCSKVIISKAPFLLICPHLRASLMAPSFASAPLLAKNTLSKQLFSVSRLDKPIMGSL